MAGVGYIKQVLKEFSKDKVGQLSAAFAYGAIFSLGPLLLVLIGIVGLVYGAQAAQGKLFGQLSGTLGSSTATTIQQMVAHINQSKSGILALVIGGIGMLLGAAGITSQLQNAFDTIFGVVPDPKGGLKRTIYVKLKNISIVILASLFVAASLVASALISGLGNHVQRQFGVPPIVLEILNNLVSLTVFIVLIYLLYKTLPDVSLPNKVTVAGAAVVSLLFLVGKIILGIVIGRNGTASAYGAAAALVTLLLWIYYSGQIIFIGAEGLKVYGFNNSLNYPPKKYNLSRTTVQLDTKGYSGRLAEAWTRGARKSRAASSKSKKK